jgi:hypothetical protein
MTNNPSIEDRISRWCEQDPGREDEDYLDLLCEAAAEIRELREALESRGAPPVTHDTHGVGRHMLRDDMCRRCDATRAEIEGQPGLPCVPR